MLCFCLLAEQQVFDKSLCGRVWLTVNSKEIKRDKDSTLNDALEMNWDFSGCSSIPKQVSIYLEYIQKSSIILISIYIY